jgi:hypothetical protein
MASFSVRRARRAVLVPDGDWDHDKQDPGGKEQHEKSGPGHRGRPGCAHRVVLQSPLSGPTVEWPERGPCFGLCRLVPQDHARCQTADNARYVKLRRKGRQASPQSGLALAQASPNSGRPGHRRGPRIFPGKRQRYNRRGFEKPSSLAR